jgi:Family of unknown function (DUF5694)
MLSRGVGPSLANCYCATFRYMKTGFFLIASILMAALSCTCLGQEEFLTGHYEGTATNQDHQVIPLLIDVIETHGTLSGTIDTPLGVFRITSGVHQGDGVTFRFEASGQSGILSLTLNNERLVGTFALGSDGGPVEAKKTAGKPQALTDVKSSFAVPILFLGVYHMNNPGLDAVNLQADDVLSAKRQKEIDQLVGRLATFKPTKIAIEGQYGDSYWPDRYKKYVAGQYTLGRNEIEQIAFRLARCLDLQTVYPIDFLMFMNGLTPSEIQNPRSGKDDVHEIAPLSTEDQLLRQSTVVEYLLHLNSASEIQQNHEQYMVMLAPTDDPAIYSRADQVANWYKRNLRIFSNINRIVVPGKDRVLVVIGSGHLKLLKEFASDSPAFNVFEIETFLKP